MKNIIVVVLIWIFFNQAASASGFKKRLWNRLTMPLLYPVRVAELAWYQTELNVARSYCDLKPVTPDALEIIQKQHADPNFTPPVQERKWVKGGKLRYILISVAMPLIFTELYVRDSISTSKDFVEDMKAGE